MISRYLLKEILVPLLVWVGFLFLLLLVMQFLRGTDVLLGSAVGLADIALLMGYLAPHFLVMALPVALLLAILLGLGRLSEDRELTALQALGVGPWSILRVPVVLGLLASGLMWILASTLEPWGLSSLQAVVNEVIKRNVMGNVKPGVFYEELPNLTLYAERVDGRAHRWENVLVHDDQDPAAAVLVLARTGRISAAAAGEEIKLVLEEGDVHRANRSTTDYSVLHFDRAVISVRMADTLWRQNKFRSPSEELTPGQLRTAAHEAVARGENATPLFMAYHSRFGRALTPFAFALLAAPLGLGGRRGRKARGYVATLGAYVAYYILMRTSENMGAQGRLPVVLAAQLPNLIFMTVGLGLFAWVFRRGEQR